MKRTAVATESSGPCDSLTLSVRVLFAKSLKAAIRRAKDRLSNRRRARRAAELRRRRGGEEQ